MNPLITLAMTTYNHERFIGEALKGAFSQTYHPLEIIVSDDCSEDGTFDIIRNQVSCYKGDHQFRINRNHRNIGVARNLNRILKMAKGELILFAAGDDISLPDRAEKTSESWLSSQKKTLALFTQARVIDEMGYHHGLYLSDVTTQMLTAEWMIKQYPVAHGYGLAISKTLIDLFGLLPEDITREDTILPIRAAILEPLKYLETPLVYYRRHNQNLSKIPGVDIICRKELFNYLRLHSKGHIAICKSYIRDLNVAENIVPNKRERFYLLRQYAEEKLRIFIIEDKLLNASHSQRLKILTGEFSRKTNIKKLLEWALIFYFPTFYLRYKRYRRRNLVKKYGSTV